MSRRSESTLIVGIICGALFATCALSGCASTDETPAPPTSVPSKPRSELVPSAALPAVTFTQLDIELDDGKRPDSQWGNARLTYVGADPVQYFNLLVDGRWVVRNFPTPSQQGTGVRQTLAFHFQITDRQGTDVTAVSYSFALTPSVLTAPPANVASVRVEPQHYALHTGVGGHPITFSPPGSVLPGGQAAGGKTTHPDFPNQQAGDFECAPVAASNSLQWLNTTQKLGLAAADISIAAMKLATKFNREAKGSPDNWPELKDEYLKAKKIPITTTRLDRLKLSEVEDAMKRGCDVELSVLRRVDGKLIGHVVAITSIQKLDGGNYALVMTHDTDQNARGGTVDEAVTYDGTTGRFSGPTWINNKAPDSFIAECANGKS